METANLNFPGTTEKCFLSSSRRSCSVRPNNDSPLTYDEVREMRVRDLKWRLKRRHGYSAEEVGRMIDKKDLIRALIREEDKQRSKERAAFQRFLFWRAVGFAIVAVVVVMGWPVWTHVWEVGNVNLTVYIDRKWLEAKRCVEYKSFWGIVGVVLMGIVDFLQLWMSVSILATWLITRTPQNQHLFFPIPNLPLRPGQFMGEKVAKGPLGGYVIISMVLLLLSKSPCNLRLRLLTFFIYFLFFHQ